MDQYSCSFKASTVAKYLTNGANPNKLVIGIPAYGRSYELENLSKIKPGSPALGPGTPGTITQEAGVLSYFEVSLTNLNIKF